MIERRIELVGLRIAGVTATLVLTWASHGARSIMTTQGGPRSGAFFRWQRRLPSRGKYGPGAGGRNGTRVITYYFRTGFVLESEVAGAALPARLVADDGAIVYLNGARVLSLGMPNDEATAATRPTRTVGTPDLEGPF